MVLVKKQELLAAVRRAVELGLAGAAIADRFGNTSVMTGALTEDEVRAILGTVTNRLAGEGAAHRMFHGKMVEVSFNGRTVGVGIASQFVFVVVVLAEVTRASRALASALLREVEQLYGKAQTDLPGAPPGTGSGGGSSSGPAELPVIEYGVTVPRRERAKA